MHRIFFEFHIRPPLLGCVEQQRGLPLPRPYSKWKQLNGVCIILGRKVRKILLLLFFLLLLLVAILVLLLLVFLLQAKKS